MKSRGYGPNGYAIEVSPKDSLHIGVVLLIVVGVSFWIAFKNSFSINREKLLLLILVFALVFLVGLLRPIS